MNPKTEGKTRLQVVLGPDDLVVNVPEDVRDDLIRFLRWRHSHRRGAFWSGSSMGEVTLAVARAVADARGIPHAALSLLDPGDRPQRRGVAG